jgi:hypothetical protein
MKTPQHLFALTRPEQRIVLTIVLGLLLAAAFTHYHKAAGTTLQPIPAKVTPDSKPAADENAEEE